MRTTAAITFAALIGITACQGDDDVAPTLPTDPSTTTVSTVADPATTTGPVPTTTPTTSTTPPTTTPSTDPPIDEAAEKQAVIDAAIASWTAFNVAKLDPTSDEKLDRVLSLTSGEQAQRATEIISNFRVLGQASRTSQEFPAAIVIDGASVVVAGDRASLLLCEVNSNILVEVGGAPDGGDAIVDSSTRTVTTAQDLELVDGEWRVADGEVLAAEPGGTSCDA